MRSFIVIVFVKHISIVVNIYSKICSHTLYFDL